MPSLSLAVCSRNRIITAFWMPWKKFDVPVQATIMRRVTLPKTNRRPSATSRRRFGAAWRSGAGSACLIRNRKNAELR